MKRQIADKTTAKTVEILSDQQANRAARIQTVADKLLNKIDKIVDRIPVDAGDGAKAIRQAAAALKDIRDIQIKAFDGHSRMGNGEKEVIAMYNKP